MFIFQEQSDVFVDACAADHHAQLLFISVFGRDTSIQQFMARLHQPCKDGGVDDLTLCTGTGGKPALKLLVGDARRLEKITGRMPRTGLLGNLVHAWIFDPALLEVDHAAQAAWIFDRLDSAVSQAAAPQEIQSEAHRASAWRLVKDLSPVPLLDAWQSAVLEHIGASGGLIRPACVGAVRTARIELSPDFAQWVSEGVGCGRLAVPDVEIPTHALDLLAA